MALIRKRMFILMACISMGCFIYWYTMEPNEYEAQLIYVVVDEEAPDTPHQTSKKYIESKEKDGCLFPSFDPFSPHAMKYYEQFPIYTCSGMPTITHYNGEVVKVNTTLKQKAFGNNKIYCLFRSVTYNRNFDYQNGEWQGPFSDVMNVAARPECVEVTCKNTEDKEVSRMHHYIVRKDERKTLKPPEHTVFRDNLMNVLMICMDSMASALFERAMPKTRDYLLKTLNATAMKKYNKVGGNTFPNIVAISTGYYPSEYKNWSKPMGFDRFPFIWKAFKAEGYRTQYATDRPDFRVFNKVPVDSFSGPMAKALMNKYNINFNNSCFEDKVEVKLWLDYIIEFARESLFTTGRFFSFAMLNRPTHDFPNEASAVDEYWFRFFVELFESGLLDNTLMVVYGDHGPRMNDYRRTFYGSLEERAANMIIYVPPSFKTRYPKHYENLQINSKRLTTNFDVHETVSNLLSLPSFSSDDPKPLLSKTGKRRALSLFSEIPRSRTCEDATIAPHYCLCGGGVSVQDPDIMKETAKSVVDNINTFLKSVQDKCAMVTLKSVDSLALLTGEVGRNSRFRILFTTRPADAKFEATVDLSVTLNFFKKYKTLGEVSRIDFYRGQSDCIDDDSLKMYCYCKNILQENRGKVS